MPAIVHCGFVVMIVLALWTARDLFKVGHRSGTIAGIAVVVPIVILWVEISSNW